jgi:hypothetical protein
MAETATATKKQPKKVFQCIGAYNEMASQLVTFNPTMLEIRDKASRAITIDRNPSGQFVLREGAAHYDEQLAALRKVCETRPWLIEIPTDGEGKSHPRWTGKDRPQEQLIEGVRRSAEQSTIEVQLGKAIETNRSLSEENEYLREQLEELKKSVKK